MKNTIKLLPVLLLGSTLGGCSLLGLGGQESNWASSTYCAPQQAQTQVQSCDSTYAAAQSQAPAYSYSAPTATPAAQTYGQTTQASYQAYTAPQVQPTQQAYQSYTAPQVQQTQPGYYQGQQAYQAQATYPVQSSYAQNAYAAPSAYVDPRFGSSKSLRQSYTYGTLGATLYDVDSDVYGVQGRVGWQSSNYYGAEVEGSFGINDDDDTFDFGAGPVATKTGVDTQIAAFAVGRYPVTDKFNVLGRVGYHNTEFDTEFDDGTTVLEDDFSEDGIAYGVGAEYAFDPKTALRLDYTRYSYDGPDGDSLALAVARKF